MVSYNELESLRNPDVFKTPEGYFDTLTSRIMDNIPEESSKVVAFEPKKTSLFRSRKTWFGIAGSTVVAACVAVAVTLNVTTEDKGANIAENNNMELLSSPSSSYEEDILTYSMADANDVYCYLAGESY